ncbi:MAG: CoA transferase [Proteobacteria bacterium]|nr:CoA transferase [Pseudomonadota bacterium]
MGKGLENTGKPNLPRPLEGIRVLECAIWHAGPGGSAILGDLGAEVIKIETIQGDPERQQKGLGAVQFEIEGNPDWSFLFEFSNRNKKGICLDINSQKGRRILHRLVENADVFVTNLRKSTKPKMGVDYESLSKINPGIVHANMSGFGAEGPMADIGGFDPMGQAISGMMFLSADDEPVYLQSLILDQMASITLSHAILTALLTRERHGIGQEIHVSLYSSAMMLTQANIMATSMMKKNPIVPWDRFKNSPLRNNFKCGDGKWLMGTNHPEQKYWPTFCETTGMEHLVDDPRYAKTSDRLKNAAELVEIFDEVFLRKSREEWMRIFIERGLMFAPVQKLSEVVEDPQTEANNYIVDFDHPHFGKVRIPGYPASFSANSAGTHSAAPGLGEHTDSVMKSLGISDTEIQALKEECIIK